MLTDIAEEEYKQLGEAGYVFLKNVSQAGLLSIWELLDTPMIRGDNEFDYRQYMGSCWIQKWTGRGSSMYVFFSSYRGNLRSRAIAILEEQNANTINTR